MIVDGRALAREVLARAKARAARLARRPLVVALVMNETAVTKSYLAIKQKKATEAGCTLEVQNIPINRRPSEIVEILKAKILESDADADAIIVQLPLPDGVDAKLVCNAIPVSKDADVLSSAARALFEMKDLRNLSLLPPVVGAVKEILEFGKIKIQGKKAVVIGSGFLVGAPVATWLTQQDAQVNVINNPSDFAVARVALATADIIISGAGSPHLITPDMLKKGVVLIDAGTSESDGAIAGDADPSCAPKCFIFTPVPGGVGPLAVACLFENAVTLAERAINK